jgi:uncharacterized protein (TIGR02996 family)
VTTEDDFQKALDTRPSDWQTRLVFADWLDECADPRADGYRALGRLRLRPLKIKKQNWWTAQGEGPPTYNHLPPDWFEQVAGYPHRSDGRWRWPTEFNGRRDNRRPVEDAAALAFGKLPPARRAELLATEPPAEPNAVEKTPKKRKSSRTAKTRERKT